jgi:S1-C subfamily serine protease
VALGSVALSVMPVLGVVAVVGGVGLGAGAGAAVDSTQSTLRYADVIRVPMLCHELPDSHATPPAEAPRYGFGIRGLPLPEARSAGLADRTAALVTRVDAGSPAARAGMRTSDVVIQAGGTTVNDATDLEQRLAAQPRGTAVAIVVWRDGRTVELQLTRPPREAE